MASFIRSKSLGPARYLNNGTLVDSGGDGVVGTLLDAAESAFPQLKLARRVLKTKFGYDITFWFIGLYVLYGLSFPISWLMATIGPRIVWLFSSSIIIPQNSPAFEACIDWVTANVVNQRSRLSGGAQTLTAFSGNKNRNRSPKLPMGYQDPFNNQQYGSFNDDTFQPLTFTPSANGSLWISDGWQFWRWIHFKHKFDKTALRSHGTPILDEGIHITCLGWSTAPLEIFIKKCREVEGRSSGATRFHILRKGVWQPPGQRPSRPLSTVDIDADVKEALVADIDNFLRSSTRRFYARRGIPFRRGLLFYGAPGTGKTSMSIALAGHTNLDLYILDLANFQGGDFELANAFEQIPTKCIVLIEDIDSTGIRREGEQGLLQFEQDQFYEGESIPVRPVPGTNTASRFRSRGVTLSGLLNVIDGVAAREGRVIVMTTNDPEALDPALIRPGRVDMKVHFGPVEGPTAKAIFLRIYTKDPDDFDDAEQMLKQKIDPDTKTPSTAAGFRIVFQQTFNDMQWLEGLASDFGAMIPGGLLTPAEVQGFLLERMQDPERAVQDVGNWVHCMKRQKAAGRKVMQASPELKPINGSEQDVDGEIVSSVEDDSL